VRVGGKGASDQAGSVGGWPNGGDGDPGQSYSGGGGGSSQIWIGTTELVEAGGGGGASDDVDYGRGDAAPTDGGNQGTMPGGNQRGGDHVGSYGGGGGGGWNPGAGGDSDRGGEGGSSYIAVGHGDLTAGANSGNGKVTITWMVDSTPPTIDQVTADPTYIGDATLVLSGDDGPTGSGIASYHYNLDGVEQTGDTVVVSAPSDGIERHFLTFWAVDNAGNVSDQKQTEFMVGATNQDYGIVRIDIPATGNYYFHTHDRETDNTIALCYSDYGQDPFMLVPVGGPYRVHGQVDGTSYEWTEDIYVTTDEQLLELP
jgi:hypothetical protein